MNKEIKLKFKVDIETFKGLIAACVVSYQKFLKNYQYYVTEDAAAALTAYQWANENVDRTRTSDPEVLFKLTLPDAFALLSALDNFANNHPLSLVIAQEIKDKAHAEILAKQNAYRIQEHKELLHS